jgi:hypothetical protein
VSGFLTQCALMGRLQGKAGHNGTPLAAGGEYYVPQAGEKRGVQTAGLLARALPIYMAVRRAYRAETL